MAVVVMAVMPVAMVPVAVVMVMVMVMTVPVAAVPMSRIGRCRENQQSGGEHTEDQSKPFPSCHGPILPSCLGLPANPIIGLRRAVNNLRPSGPRRRIDLYRHRGRWHCAPGAHHRVRCAENTAGLLHGGLTEQLAERCDANFADLAGGHLPNLRIH